VRLTEAVLTTACTAGPRGPGAPQQGPAQPDKAPKQSDGQTRPQAAVRPQTAQRRRAADRSATASLRRGLCASVCGATVRRVRGGERDWRLAAGACATPARLAAAVWPLWADSGVTA